MAALTARRKSPRAPSMALDDAIDRAMRVYEKERRNLAPLDVVAQHLGYKNATNGAAATAIASLRYFGLFERPQEGYLAVSKTVEEYKFIPSEEGRKALLKQWVQTPTVFSELLEKYRDGLPSDPTLKFDLIQRGFSPEAAGVCLSVFRRSVDYARYFDEENNGNGGQSLGDPDAIDPSPRSGSTDSVPTAFPMSPPPVANASALPIPPAPSPVVSPAIPSLPPHQLNTPVMQGGIDRIPVRLAGGRRAWLEVPTPFFEADKERLKAQIDMILADKEGDAEQDS